MRRTGVNFVSDKNRKSNLIWIKVDVIMREEDSTAKHWKQYMYRVAYQYVD